MADYQVNVSLSGSAPNVTWKFVGSNTLTTSDEATAIDANCFALDGKKTGDTYTFTLTDPGTWKYQSAQLQLYWIDSGNKIQKTESYQLQVFPPNFPSSIPSYGICTFNTGNEGDARLTVTLTTSAFKATITDIPKNSSVFEGGKIKYYVVVRLTVPSGNEESTSPDPQIVIEAQT